MDKTELQEEAKIYFVPFLLGSNSASRKLARKIYSRYKIVSYILDKKRTVSDVFSLSSRFLMLSKPKNTTLTVIELVYLTEQSPYTLPILIPCSEEYERLINENKETLETSFVISSIQSILDSSPLNIIPT